MPRRSLIRGSIAARTLIASILAATSLVARAQEASLQDFADATGPATQQQLVIYLAREIVTVDDAHPSAQAVAVAGDKIVAVGSLAEVEQAVANQPHSVNNVFANEVIVPGLIAQHDHPLLAALTMTSKIIAIEDWVLPDGVAKAAKNHADYLKRVAEASAALKDPTRRW